MRYPRVEVVAGLHVFLSELPLGDTIVDCFQRCVSRLYLLTGQFSCKRTIFLHVGR